jgi:hypothetical protein
MHPSWYNLLHENKSEIETKLGFSLDWHERSDLKYAYIQTKQSVDMTVTENWMETFRWMLEKMKVIRSTFRPYVKDLPNG